MVDVTLRGPRTRKALSLESFHQGYVCDRGYVNAAFTPTRDVAIMRGNITRAATELIAQHRVPARPVPVQAADHRAQSQRPEDDDGPNAK
jgi:hypothetical protein